MKKVGTRKPPKPNESEYEELIRLRAENAYMKAEIEVIKKEIALREEKKLRDSRRKSSDHKELRSKGFQLKHLLKAMPMSKSTYYFEISKEDVVANRNKDLMYEINEIFSFKRRYGVRRVYRELLNRGMRLI